MALLHSSDRHHDRCLSALREQTEPLLTVWPAFTEAMYLLGFSWQAQEALWQFVGRGALRFALLDERDAPRMQELMETYRDLPMDLADAALVRVAERERLRRVFTVDPRDFRVYRPRGIKHFELLPQP